MSLPTMPFAASQDTEDTARTKFSESAEGTEASQWPDNKYKEFLVWTKA